MQKSINPFDQTLLGEYHLLSDQELKEKLKNSREAFLFWKKTSFAHRSDLLRRAADVLRKNEIEFGKTISLEMGKPIKESRAEILKCADACKYFAEQGAEFLRDELIKTEAIKSYVAYQPTGSILAIMPWNFPFWQVFRFAAPALMAGNVGLLKHSSNVPQCSLLIEKVFKEAGFPEGVFQSLIIDNDQVEGIIESDTIQGIALTGSEKAGSSVGALAGKHIKKSVLELGGSDPFIVLQDADLPKTVKIATQSRMQNAGQSCIAAKRFIVMKEVKDSFIDLFKKEIDKLKQGNPLHDETETGPMARLDLAEELEVQMKRSIDAGARLITGGKRKGANFQPGLMDGVSPGMPLFDEETFGPLAGVTWVNNEKMAVELANKSRYGLGASVWTTDLERGERMALEIESGTVYINSLMRSDSRLPFGGIKKSGYGRELFQHGIREFVNVKTISVNE
jgi:succinate-semialdehyde dehydrogenase / glutarate-semialdehyde dehydrogenase